MKYEVRLTSKAQRDIDKILSWFSEQDATTAGGRWVTQLLAKIDTLEAQPQRCPIAAEADRIADLRELRFGRRRGVYRILFVICGIAVDILHIRHSARDAASGDEFSSH